MLKNLCLPIGCSPKGTLKILKVSMCHFPPVCSKIWQRYPVLPSLPLSKIATGISHICKQDTTHQPHTLLPYSKKGMIWQTNLSAPSMTEVMSSCSQSRNFLTTLPQIFSCWKDRHFHNRFTFVTWLNNMPLTSFSVLLGANLTPTKYTLVCAQIKVTNTLVWGNITLVPSAISIHELLKIMTKNVKVNI